MSMPKKGNCVVIDNNACTGGTNSPRWIFLSDVPPCEGAPGCHFVAANFCSAFANTPSVLVTRRFTKKINKEDILSAAKGMPIEFWSDFTPLGLRQPWPFIRSKLDTFAFKMQLTKLVRRLTDYRPTRIFALAGDSPYFLEAALLLATAMELPLDMYLVDDFEESAKARRDSVAQRWVCKNEENLLRRCARVWTISEGYGEHLLQKYGIKSDFLPVTMPQIEVTYHPISQQDNQIRRFCFLGSVNHLYLDSLVAIYRVIEGLNLNEAINCKLTIYTASDPIRLREMLGDTRYLDVVLRVSDMEMRRALSTAYVILLPYSFFPSEKLIVSTSFSCKTAEALGAGRPILVYGPEYASVPRYFQSHNLPMVVTSEALLQDAILDIPLHDNPETIQRYARLAKTFHAPDAVLERLEASLD